MKVAGIMADRKNVFISSTALDLTKYRDKVKEVVLAHGMFPISMEEFQPTKDNALQKCYDEVQNAEIFIGIYAHRYGYAPDGSHTYVTTSGEVRPGDGETSITHLEYLWARERDLRMLLFVLADQDENDEPIAWQLKYVEDEPTRSRLNQFKDHLKDQHVVKFFHSPDDLAAKAATALASVSRETTGKAPRRRAEFYKHIPLPPNYITRRDLLDELRLALIGDDDVALTSAIKSAQALHGMGGIGKSVMARALCEEPLVQTAFPDGILWTTLGSEVTEADIRQKLRDWILALGGGIEENAPSLELLQSKLATLLEDRACLLILDDVWKKKDAEAFRVAGHRCRLLITTRDAEVARSLGANIQPVPVMTVDEAVALLEEWAAGIVDTPRVLKDKIVTRLGRLPLAIKLAGGQLSRRDPQTWLERFDARKLEDRRGAPDDPHSSLARCFTLSLEDLREMDRKLYAALTIFREDEPILEAAITRLWEGLEDLDADGTQDLIDDLAARALMEVAGEHYPRAVVLHDLLRDFMRSELADGEATAHQALLTAYKMSCTGDKWYTAPDDGYLYDHLGYHLKRAGRTDEFHTLVTASRDWMDARFRQSYGDYTFVKDIELLLEDYKDLTDTERIIPHAQLVTARQVINARVAVYTDDLLQALVWVRRDREAMNHALLRSEPKKRFDGLLNILQALAEREGKNITELEEYSHLGRAVDSIAISSEKALALAAIASTLAHAGLIDESKSALEKALAVAQTIDNPYSRNDTLDRIASNLANAEQFDSALRIVGLIENPSTKAEGLANISFALVDTGYMERSRAVMEETLRVAQTTNDPTWRAFSLIVNGKVEEGLHMAQSIGRDYWRPGYREILSHIIAGKVPLQALLDSIHSIDDVIWRSQILIDIVSSLCRLGRTEEALRVAQSVELVFLRVQALGTVASALAQNDQESGQAREVFEETLQELQTIEDYTFREFALKTLVWAFVHISEVREVVHIAQLMGRTLDEPWLAKIAAVWSGMGRFEEALQVSAMIEDASFFKLPVVACITLELAKNNQIEQAQELLEQTLITARQLGTQEDLSVLSTLASTLVESGRSNEALQVVHTIIHRPGSAEVMQKIASAMAKVGQIDDALLTARETPRPHDKVKALLDVGLSLARTGQEKKSLGVIQEAVDATQSVKDYRWEALMLRSIASTLARCGQKEAALRIAYGIALEDGRTAALGEIAIELARSWQVDEALELAQIIEDPSIKTSAMRAIASRLVRKGELTTALSIGQNIENKYDRASILGAIASALAQVDRIEKAVKLAQLIEDESVKATALKSIAVKFAEKGRIEEAFEISELIQEPSDKVRTLAMLTKALARSGQFERLQMTVEKALDELPRIVEPSLRKWELRDLAANLACAGQIKYAISLLGSLDIYMHMEFIMGFRQDLVEHVEDGEQVWRQLCVAVLDIVMWVRPSWREVRDILAA